MVEGTWWWYHRTCASSSSLIPSCVRQLSYSSSRRGPKSRGSSCGLSGTRGRLARDGDGGRSACGRGVGEIQSRCALCYARELARAGWRRRDAGWGRCGRKHAELMVTGTPARSRAGRGCSPIEGTDPSSTFDDGQQSRQMSSRASLRGRDHHDRAV